MKNRSLLSAVAGAAGLFTSPAGNAGAVTVPSVPVAEAPKLDGVWRSGEWKQGGALPLANHGRREKPEVRIVETEAGLYLGILMRDDTPVYGRSVPGDSLHQEDVFEIFFENAQDARRYAELQIARSGAAFHKTYVLKAEPAVTATGRLTPEYLEKSFQETIAPVPRGVRWATGSADGWWVAEVFLPRHLLGPELRANFAVHNWDRSLGEAGRAGRFYYWSAIEAGCPHISSSRFGRLILQ